MGFSWPIFRKIAGRQVEKAKGFFDKEPERIDQNLPLGLRFSAMVGIPESDFILAGSDNLKITYPQDYGTVTAYGTFRIGESTGHRFYITFKDGQVYMLQVIAGKDGNIEECKLFMPLEEYFPAGTADWAFWIAEDDGYIGFSVYDIGEGEEKTRYHRVWENTGDERVVTQEGELKITRIPPVQFQETLFLDENGGSKEQVDYAAMLYGRWISEEDDIAEYLLVTKVEDQGGAAVRLMVGLEIPASALTIL